MIKVFSFEEAMKASLEYFNGDELAAKVFLDKYALRDGDHNLLEKTPEDMHRRIAKEFARIQKDKYKKTKIKPLSEDELFNYFDRFLKIIPQGSPMYAIGNPYQYVSAGNCFVLPNPHDSYLGIMYTDTQITQISCRRGGVGWGLDNLRPENERVQNAARTTSGAISFAKRFSNTIREVGQYGRRGASLQSLNSYHPSIIDFIKVKRNLKEVTGSNISVQFKDSFMEAVVNDSEIELYWPLNGEEVKVKQTIKAREVWNEFVHSAWLMAEPGCMFIDTVHKNSTSSPYGMVETSSNPCVARGTLVNTPRGYVPVENIKEGDLISTLHPNGSEAVKKIETHKDVDVFKVIFSDGGEQIVTAAHRYHVQKHGQNSKFIQKLRLDEISIGDSVVVEPTPLHDSELNTTKFNEGVLLGVLLGDGLCTNIDQYGIRVATNQDDVSYNEAFKTLCRSCFGCEFNEDDIDKNSKSMKMIFNKASSNMLRDKFEIPECKSYEKYIPIKYMNDYSYACGIVNGILATDGNVNLKSNHPQIRFDTSSDRLAKDIRKLLLNLGIHGRISDSSKKGDGNVNSRMIERKHPSFTVSISSCDLRTLGKICFDNIHPDKSKKVKYALFNSKLTGGSRSAKVVSIEAYGKSDVYDLYCEQSDTWITEGYVQQGCGEQFLPPYASCRLLVINLLTYVKNKFTKEAFFDFDEFYEDVKVLQRLGDDLVDLEIECVDRILDKIKSDPEPDYIKQIGLDLWKNVKDVAEKDRRTGCGFTALGDAIAGLNLNYDSNESIEFIEKMQQKFKFAAYESSIEMAEDLGPFPLYDKALDRKSEFIQRFKDENLSLYKRMAKSGRRNMVLLTIAPTGSVSCLTQTSSGLEPVFLLEYTRRKKGNPGDVDFKTDFIDDNGDHWMHFNVLHKGLQEWKDITKNDNIEDSPYFNSVAEKIDWIKRVEIQSALQKHIDNSISSTINLPNDVEEGKVSEIYLESWRKGLKGVTVYRDGCRSGVLIKKEETTESKTEEVKYKKRPKELMCDVHHIKVTKRLDKPRTFDYLVVVGILDGNPYEVFVKENGSLSKKYKTGVIKKVKRGVYSVDLEDEIVIDDITSDSSEEEDSVTRLVSTSLRHGVELQYIVEQLEKAEGDMWGFSKAIARTLKKYIKDGTKVTGTECPSCGSTSLERREGCITCMSCGWSRCS